MGLKYEPALDGLRAVAIIGVLLRHADVPGFNGGGRGVDVFFVLSGYLITSRLLEDPADFWRRRAARLYPAMIVMVAVVTPIAALLRRQAGDISDAAIALAYLTNLNQAAWRHFSPLEHLWSLAMEAQFYLLWPFFVGLLRRTRRPARWLLAAWAVVSVGRLALYLVTSDPNAAYYGPIHCTGLILGAALAFGGSLRPAFALAGLTAIFASYIVAPNGFIHSVLWSIPLAEIGSASVILGLARPSSLKLALEARPLVWVGVLSYGLYLWHFPIGYLAHGHSFAVKLLVSGLGGLAAAWLSFATVERWGRTLLAPNPRLATARAPVA